MLRTARHVAAIGALVVTAAATVAACGPDSITGYQALIINDSNVPIRVQFTGTVLYDLDGDPVSVDSASIVLEPQSGGTGPFVSAGEEGHAWIRSVDIFSLDCTPLARIDVGPQLYRVTWDGELATLQELPSDTQVGPAMAVSRDHCP